jgi:hypothetical protein
MRKTFFVEFHNTEHVTMIRECYSGLAEFGSLFHKIPDFCYSIKDAVMGMIMEVDKFRHFSL